MTRSQLEARGKDADIRDPNACRRHPHPGLSDDSNRPPSLPVSEKRSNLKLQVAAIELSQIPASRYAHQQNPRRAG